MKVALQRLFVSFFFFFTLTSVASASISTISGYPTDPQPFGVFCQPYTFAFASGHHYMPFGGANCTYSLPVTDPTIIATYEGKVGSSTVITADYYFGTATKVITSPGLFDNTFKRYGTPAPEQDFFNVVYDASLLGSDFNNYLQHGGTIPADAKKDVNYWIMSWKWGPVPVSEYEPVVVVPGILGSWQKDGKWVIDPVGHTYDNLLDTFRANGYIDGKTLFAFTYNWENSNTTTAQVLKDQIDTIKKSCACSHVNLVTHSMGGLVARQYIQSPDYQYDVDQLVFIATPHLGAPAAYQAWEAGQIEFGGDALNALMNRIFTNEAKANKYKDVFSYIQGKPVTSVKELLPVYDYLFTPTQKIYPAGYPQNSFLENLDKHFNGWNGVRTTNIEADNKKSDTVDQFRTVASTQLPMWADGMPTTTYKGAGDGTVPKESIENFMFPDKKFYNTDHPGVVSTSSAYVFETLNNRPPNSVVNKQYSFFQKDWKVIFIKLFSPIDMQIVAPDGKRLGKDFANNTELNEMPDAFYSGFNTDDEYAVIVDPLPGDYIVKTIGTGSGGHYTIATDLIDPTGDVESDANGTTTPGQVIINKLSVSLTTHSITIKPADTDPPTITITSPTNKSVVLKTANVFIKTIIEDQSPIATTTYWFNGKKINPLLPLPLASVAAPSAQSLSVSASDVFGNTATSSVSLYVVKSSSTCAADLITYLQLQNLNQLLSQETAKWAVTACQALK